MPDRVNNELLSAYLDNEVTDAERAQVEQALASSAEVRTQFESLKQVQARLRAVPQVRLPADFHQRVLEEAARRSAAEADPLMAPAAADVVSPHVGVVPIDGATSTGSNRWMRMTAFAATIAALLLVSVIVSLKPPTPMIVQNPPDESVDSSDELPGDYVLVAADRNAKKYIMVLDIALTKKAQQDDVFGQGLKLAKIPLDLGDDEVRLDDDLRNDLLSTRFASDVTQPAAGRVNEKFDIIDMVYVQATGPQIDKFYKYMWKHKEARPVVDFAFKPDSTRVLNSIGEKSWSLAKTDRTHVPVAYAYRLNVGLNLHSASRSGFLAKFPTPRLDLNISKGKKSKSGFSLELPMEMFGGEQAIQPARPPQASETTIPVTHAQICEVLIIRRNLTGGFPKNAQKSDDQ